MFLINISILFLIKKISLSLSGLYSLMNLLEEEDQKKVEIHLTKKSSET